jgi:hypothetical protein
VIFWVCDGGFDEGPAEFCGGCVEQAFGGVVRFDDYWCVCELLCVTYKFVCYI